MRKFFLFFTLFALIFSFIFPQSFEKNIQGNYKGLLKENISQIISKNELWALPPIPLEDPFFIGWELEVSLIGDSVSRPINYMISFYSSVRPYPQESISNYKVWDKGTKILNSGRSFSFQILDLEWAPRNQWQIVSLKRNEYPLLFVLEPTFQSNYTDNSSEATFTVTAKPIYNQQGILRFEIYDENTKEIISKAKISLDSKTINWPDSQTILQNKGIYTINVQASGYEERRIQIQIEPGRENNIPIGLAKSKTKVLFNALDIVEIFLDGEKIDQNQRVYGAFVDPGSHNVTFTLGSFSTTKSFFAKEGKTYQVDLNFSLDLQEIPFNS